MPVLIRPEALADAPAIFGVTEAAFRTAAQSAGTEQFIVSALRRAGALAVSLLAELDGSVIGHVAVSPVTVSDGSPGWYGLGPISVLPPEYFRAVSFGPPLPRGLANFHEGFAATS